MTGFDTTESPLKAALESEVTEGPPSVGLPAHSKPGVIRPFSDFVAASLDGGPSVPPELREARERKKLLGSE